MDEKTCQQCGSTYRITSTKIIMRDKDSITCDVCGAVLMSWNGARIYHAQLLQRAEWPARSK